MSGNSDLSVFDHPIEEDGMNYYVFPAGYPLFKANQTNKETIFSKGYPSFFGMKNMLPEYIKSYEDEYGIIFEYITRHELNLLALDDPVTQSNLYNKAPSEIQKILKDNYGYIDNDGNGTGIRNSVGEKDKQFAKFLCSFGYDGYATNKMKTDFGGEFHIELLICDASTEIEFVRRITNDAQKIESILEKAKLKRLGEMQEAKRQEAKRNKKRRYEDEDTMDISVSPPGRNMFESPPRVTAPMELSNYDSPQATSSMAFSNYDSPQATPPPSTPPPSTLPPSTPPISNGIFSFFSSPSTPKGGKKREKKTYKKNAKGKRKTNRRRTKK